VWRAFFYEKALLMSTSSSHRHGQPHFVPVFEILHCLTSPVRMEIALAVASERRDVSALASLLGFEISTISRSLRDLAACGIVEYNGVGAHHVYGVGTAARFLRVGSTLRVSVSADDESVVTMDLSPAALKPMLRSLTRAEHEPSDAEVPALLERFFGGARDKGRDERRDQGSEVGLITTVARALAPRGGAPSANHHSNGHGSR